ncbi:phospholipase D-like domain-containing protein [Singulisphaera sp. Ch08]|uniref:phospholipase D n=1 Tax=Singulisphaera sp. Ch08 TaxID=3120278 RepID=A0AAU7CJJ2_9BACT
MKPARYRPVHGKVPCAEGLESRHLLSGGRSLAPVAEVRALRGGPATEPPRLFIEPEAGRGPILRAITAAKSEIRVGICNFSDPELVDALLAARARGVNVRVILDRADYLAKPPEQQQAARLTAGGVQVRLSNPVFPQSFPKYILVDQRQVMIMTMCIVPPTFQDTRDYGVVLGDPRILREVAAVFETDWASSAPAGVTPPPYNPTPAINDPRLIVAPTNASAQLSRLITGARHTLEVTSEVVDDAFLQGQLVAAARRGVRVRLIAPVRSRAGNDNLPALRSLADNGVAVHVTTSLSPDPTAMPYLHAKSMVVDRRTVYLGSIDLDATETGQDRELGIILQRPTVARRLRSQFQSDWLRTNDAGPTAVG